MLFLFVFMGIFFATLNGLSEESGDSVVPVLPALEIASAQNMYHATAWYGGTVSLSFITPSENSAWKAVEGAEIESWSVGYYDLLARRNSKGILITLENPIVRDYTYSSGRKGIFS